MSIISGFNKVKNYVKTTEGFKLLSRWTSSDTVDVNGKTLTETISGINTSINGKANSSHTHGNGDITSLDASKITSGTIDLARLPQGALERLTVVADDTARFKLTSTSVQKGDTVKVTFTGKMYYVVDDTKLSTEDGYEVYAAGTAASVPWSGVTDKPSTYTPSSHTHTKSQITDFPTSMPANGGNATTVNGHTVNSDVPSGAKFTDTNTWRPQPDWNATSGDAVIKNKPSLAKVATSGSYNDLSNKPTIPTIPSSLPANGGTSTYANYVYATSHQGSWYQNSQWDGTYFQTNYKDSRGNALPMKVNNAGYADSAGSVAWSNVSGRPSSLPASDVYSWAKASSKPSYTASEVGALEKSGGTMKGNIYMDGKSICFYSSTQKIEANDQDLNLYAAGKSSSAGYVNARVASAFQVRNLDNSAWRPINAISFNMQSSKRYKKNITNMSDVDARKLLKYRVVNYDYINEMDGIGCNGLIAEEVAEIDEYPIYRTADGTIEGLDYSKFVPKLIKMVQIQQQEIDNLKEMVKD